jgi:glycerol-3-phosphate O-acyltransferase
MDASQPKGLSANPMLRVLYSRFFDAIQVDDAWVKAVRELAQQGRIVYVLRSLNPVDFLALDHLTRRYDLPQVGFVNELNLGVLNPNPTGLLELFSKKKQSTPPDALRHALEDNRSAALFLKRPPGVVDIAAGASGGRGLREGDELMAALIDLQRHSERPILLVPQVFMWTNRPDTHGAQLMDMFLGPREWPTPLRTVAQFLGNYKGVVMRAGEPLNLAQYLRENAGPTDDTHVRRVIYVMLRRLERERLPATGPALVPPDRQRHQVMRSPKLQQVIAHMAGDKPDDRHALTRQTNKMLREMQATPDSATVSALEVLLHRVFHRIYAGIDVDRAGLDAIREKSKEATIVLLPSHKSHVDYLVLSYVFKIEGLSLPIIAAGDNLSFFPLGPVLRRAGGFFIRRKFSGDKLYSATVEAYVRRLLRDGHTLEVFIEGGRSRTGKALRPQLGLLSMITDGALAIPNRQVYFVPISIGYERIVETSSYGKELLGGDKEKEDATGLLKSTEVLRHRYGRINVQFGQHLDIQGICRDLSCSVDDLASPPRRRAVVTRMGNRTMDEINRVTAVTPGALTALALLSDERRSISHEELLLRARQLLRVLLAMNARVTPRTAVDGELREDSVDEAVQMFMDGDLIEVQRPGEAASAERRDANPTGDGSFYRIAERKRIELDTSKNIIVHFFVERGLVSIAMLMHPGPDIQQSVVRERVRKLSELFKHEFRFRADASFDTIFEDTLRTMEAAGEIEREGDRLDAGAGRDGWSGRVWLRTYAAILRNFVEGYRVAARGLSALTKGPLTEKDLLKRMLTLGQRMYLSGDIERHEAISKPILQNALTAFKDEGYVQVREGKCSLTSSFASPEAVRAIEGRIAGYLERSKE